jgi:tRNA splicing endonuclease
MRMAGRVLKVRRAGRLNMGLEDSGVSSKGNLSESKYFCEEGRRLLDLFGSAVQELLLLHEQQFLAVVEGDASANRFDLLIHHANEKKQNAKYAYMRHLEEHGCSSNYETNNS